MCAFLQFLTFLFSRSSWVSPQSLSATKTLQLVRLDLPYSHGNSRTRSTAASLLTWRKHPWRDEGRPCGMPMRRHQLNPVSTWTRPGHFRVPVEAPIKWNSWKLWIKVNYFAVHHYLLWMYLLFSHRDTFKLGWYCSFVFLRTSWPCVRTGEESVQSGKRNSHSSFQTAGAAKSVKQSPQRPGRTRTRPGQGQPGAESSHRQAPTAGGQGITHFVHLLWALFTLEMQDEQTVALCC